VKGVALNLKRSSENS